MMGQSLPLLLALSTLLFTKENVLVNAWCSVTRRAVTRPFFLLSDSFLENDLVAVWVGEEKESPPRLCVVRPDGTVAPLCQHEDDVETDLWVDPRLEISEDDIEDSQISSTFGEGWYGQRPVPSLGGGPGYGAEADEIWSIDQGVLEQIKNEGVELPVLDIGIAHGEKARGGAY